MEPLIYPSENNGTFYCLLEMERIDVELFTMHNILGVQTSLRLPPMNHLGQKAETVKKKRQHTNLIRSSSQRKSNSINHEGVVIMVSADTRSGTYSRRRSAFFT